MKHQDAVQPYAIHVPWFIGSTDPARDSNNDVTAYKAWWDTKEKRIKYRNASNTEWRYIGQGSDV